MRTAAPTHQGFDRIVLAATLLGRVFRSVRQALAIEQPPGPGPLGQRRHG